MTAIKILRHFAGKPLPNDGIKYSPMARSKNKAPVIK